MDVVANVSPPKNALLQITIRQGPQIQTLPDLPDTILQKIMCFVCPHARDDTYETCETSAALEACALCHLRDLAHCARVCKRWYDLATAMLYQSIRIDAVHYCPRETLLSERRKHKGFLRNNADPFNAPEVRLGLLLRTLCENELRLGAMVQYLKLPYALREAAGAEIASFVHMLPSLRYADFPRDLFANNGRYGTFRPTIESRCRDLRKMAYHRGAEASLLTLATNNTWRNLEALELVEIEIDPCVLRRALGKLGKLRAIKVSDTRSFSDAVFTDVNNVPPFPCLVELVLRNTPAVTAGGLLEYLSRADTRNNLTILALLDTGVLTESLPEVLSVAHNLQTLALEATVVKRIGSRPSNRRLASKSLRKLRFELTTVDNPVGSRSRILASHHAHLAASLQTNDMPNLTSVHLLGEHLVHQLAISLPRMVPLSACGADGLDPATNDGIVTLRTRAIPTDGVFRDPKSSYSVAIPQRLAIDTRTKDVVDWPLNGSQFSMPACDRLLSSYGFNRDVAGWGWNNNGASRKWIMVRDQQGVLRGLFQSRPNSNNRTEKVLWSANEESGADLWR
ncbi:putative F-box domain-containing protein [Colletotrichum sublineola]|uniref:Putative F-box domain-containing protein n=1 Tax=Colletotrichum sublineola TaxID=1173701 RepID=A0A066X5R6_COLSU|nr:putative F-box domain-containing protein [Colletotrichum sublineola]